MDSDLLKTRIRKLNSSQSDKSKAVLYLMSRDQRVQDNHALIAAQKHANAQKIPLYVAFFVYQKTGQRVKQHYDFMLEGLEQVRGALKKLNIPFILRLTTAPTDSIIKLVNELDASALYFDFNPLRGPKKMRDTVAKNLSTPCFEVDTHNLIPLWVTSDKEEYAAHTIRRKIHTKFAEYLEEPDQIQKQSLKTKSIQSATFEQAKEFIKAPALGDGYHLKFVPGEQAGHNMLNDFIATRLREYAFERNNPNIDKTSNLSPYLHYGQISSLRVVLELKKILDNEGRQLHAYDSIKMPRAEEDDNGLQAGVDALFEEMIVRKELADNYCYYQPNYDNLEGAKDWAKETLAQHALDGREYIYSLEEFEKAQTHEPAWNAAQKQLTTTGKIHGYMRMYWAKKILEWSESPEHAIKIAITLNDKYHLDGGDPNGYVGVMWSIAAVHDRPWTERAIFGKIRYMNKGGLKRKFDIEKYINSFT